MNLTHHRQLGHEGQEEKDYRNGQNAQHEGGAKEVQERFPDRDAKRGEGGRELIDKGSGGVSCD